MDSCRQAPAILSVADKIPRIVCAVGAIDPSDVAIVAKIVCITIPFSLWIETEKRELGKEQVAARAAADVQLDPVVFVAVEKMVSLRGATPRAAVLDGQVRLARPARMVQAGRHAMRR